MRLEIGCCFLILNLWGLPAIAFDPMAPPGYERGNIDSFFNKKKESSNNSAKKPKKQAKDYILRQIVIHGAGKSAVINGYVVNEGSWLKGGFIQTINKESVEIIVAGKKRVLTLEVKLPKIRR